MALIERLRATWSGFPGAPGVTTLYCVNAGLQRVYLQDLFGAAFTYFPVGLQITVQNTGDIIDSATGEIRSTWSAGSPIQSGGSSTDAYAGAQGAQVTWTSDAVVRGRHLRGKTNLVPLTGQAFDAGGTLSTGFLNQMAPAIATMVTGAPGNLLVYARSFPGSPAWTDVHGRLHPAKPARDGLAFPVVSAAMKDKAIVLRSRRD